MTVGPLGIGGVIDRAVAVARLHFRPLFVAMLLLQAPALALARLASAELPSLLQLASDATLAAERAPLALAAAAGLLVTLFLLQNLALTVTAAILAPALGGATDDQPGAPGPAWSRLVPGALATGLAQQLLLVLAAGVGMVPGLLLLLTARSAATTLGGAISAAVGGLVLFLVALLRTILAPVAVGVERLGPWSALRCSSRLMAPRPGQPALERPGVRASLLILTTFALVLAVNGLAGVPRAVAGSLAGGGLLPFLPGALPLPVELALTAFELAAGAALQPFSLAVTVVFYFERRARTEGLDLQAWAASLGSTSSPAPLAAPTTEAAR